MSAVSKKKSDKKDKIILNIQRTLCYIVLIIISILCLFSFYVLLINTTRSHPDIQKGFSLIPGKSFFVNLTNLLKDKQLPVLKGMCNSLLVASGSAVLSVYNALRAAKKAMHLQPGDNVVMTGGNTTGTSGNTNLIKVETI